MTTQSMAISPAASARARAVYTVNAHLVARGITASEVAKRIGLSQSAMSRRMTAKKAFNVNELGAISYALGITIHELLSMPAEPALTIKQQVEALVGHATNGRPSPTSEPDSVELVQPLVKRHDRLYQCHNDLVLLINSSAEPVTDRLAHCCRLIEGVLEVVTDLAHEFSRPGLTVKETLALSNQS
jgi:transcriptional regulator with XRE-family HTH domain